MATDNILYLCSWFVIIGVDESLFLQFQIWYFLKFKNDMVNKEARAMDKALDCSK